MSKTLEDIKNEIETVVNIDGEHIKIDLGEVFEEVEEKIYDSEGRTELMVELSKIREGVVNLATDFSRKEDNKEDAFRKWKAQKKSLLFSKDDEDNPLVQKNKKITNKTVKAEMRSDPKYKEYKDEISKLKSFSSKMWNTMNTIDALIEFVNNFNDD